MARQILGERRGESSFFVQMGGDEGRLEKLKKRLEKVSRNGNRRVFLVRGLTRAAELWYNMGTYCGRGLGLRVSRGSVSQNVEGRSEKRSWRHTEWLRS